jgi:hypothetical protein
MRVGGTSRPGLYTIKGTSKNVIPTPRLCHNSLLCHFEAKREI